jgi:hypothetical protein
MEGHPQHCLDYIIYVVVVMVKGMMVEMANEWNFFYSEERNRCRFDCMLTIDM